MWLTRHIWQADFRVRAADELRPQRDVIFRSGGFLVILFTSLSTFQGCPVSCGASYVFLNLVDTIHSHIPAEACVYASCLGCVRISPSLVCNLPVSCLNWQGTHLTRCAIWAAIVHARMSRAKHESQSAFMQTGVVAISGVSQITFHPMSVALSISLTTCVVV